LRGTLEVREFKLRNVAAIAVSKGPGSYTGLRIVVSRQKALLALDIPINCHLTLKSMALPKQKGNP